MLQGVIKMLKLIKLDFMMLFSSKWILIAYIFGIPLLVLLLGIANYYVAFVTGVLLVIGISAFTDHKRNKDNSPILMASLPISKRDLVLSKYISEYSFFFISTIYVSLIAFFFMQVGLYKTEYIYSFHTMKFLLGLFVIGLSVSIPIKLLFNGHSNAFYSFLAFYWIVNIPRSTYDGSSSDAFVFTRAGNIIFNFVVVFSFVFSIVISLREYKDKEYY